ncbi:MAG: hypothetical protein EON61_00775 [Alphaproteobacteria bacterium]|nr:MAG: hypothetical protein EON61_00775 [Alphaproteobacteria bacterium]
MVNKTCAQSRQVNLTRPRSSTATTRARAAKMLLDFEMLRSRPTGKSWRVRTREFLPGYNDADSVDAVSHSLGVCWPKLREQAYITRYPEERAANIQMFAAAVRDFQRALNGLSVLRPTPGNLQKRIFDIFQSSSGRLVAAASSLRKCEGQQPLARLVEVASLIDRKAEIVPRAHLKPKRNGFRTICSFTAADRATMALAKFVIEATLGHSEFDMALPGRGGARGAVKKIKAAVRDGYTHWAYLDIRGAFSSVRRTHLRSICPALDRTLGHIVFPRVPVLRCACHTRDATRSTTATCTTHGSNQRWVRCLPEGAKTSAIVLSAVLGQELRRFAERDWVIITHVDDILIGTRTHAEAEEARTLVTNALRSLRSGPIFLSRSEVQSVDRSWGVNFVGYRISRWPGGRLYTRPSNESWRRFRDRCLQRLVAQFGLGPPADWEAVLTLSTDFAKRWAASFTVWRKGDRARNLIASNAVDAASIFQQAQLNIQAGWRSSVDGSERQHLPI